MIPGFETPEVVQACKEADQRIREWAQKAGIDPKMAYDEYGIPAATLGGYPIVLVIDKIIQRMAWA